MPGPTTREGSLEAPTRHPLGWRDADFYDEDKLFAELERVFDICHGCRRCVNLCQSFPTLFDLVDESPTLEVDGVARADYWKVVDHCYLCDLCYMTKCPYVPPHEWNVDFPHLLLRAKAVGFKQGRAKIRDKMLTSTDMLGKTIGIPIVVNVVNAANRSRTVRKTMQVVMGVHADATLPVFHRDTARRRLRKHISSHTGADPAGPTQGRVAVFSTCYGNYNDPRIVEDLVAVFEHNGIPVQLVDQERCCGMPKLELGDLQAVDRARQANVPILAGLLEEGWDLVAPVPSCVLMFKQEIPLMYPEDAQVQRIARGIFDPFEYLMHRHKAGKLVTEFVGSPGKIVYHAACHQRVQNIGAKTRDVLNLIPDTQVDMVARCSGHDGTYAVKSECHAASVKICRPVVDRVKRSDADCYTSDCPMAAAHIAHGLGSGDVPRHPLTLLREAYGI